MKDNIVCPCCKSNQTVSIESIKNKDLISLYRTKFNIPTEYLFEAEFTDLMKCKNCELQFYSPQTGGDEAFYNILQKIPWYYTSDKEEYRYAKENISEDESILEVGSGSGTFKEIMKNNPYLGLEFSTNAIEMANKKGIKVINETIEEHAAKNPNTYDVVVFFQVLEHVLDIKEFLEAAISVLKPNGKLIISVPSENSFLAKNVNDILNYPPHHSSRYTDDFFEKITTIFPIKLLHLKHQKLEANQKPQILKGIIYMKILHLFGLQFKRIDNSAITRFLEKISYFFGLLLSSFYNPKSMNGHTITAIYEKK